MDEVAFGQTTHSDIQGHSYPLLVKGGLSQGWMRIYLGLEIEVRT